MTKFYIQQESQEPITEIVFDGGTTDGDLTISCFEDNIVQEIRISTDKRGAFYVAKSNIDLFIQALQKAKEVWGE